MFDLTAHIAASRRETARRYIILAAREIMACPDERKRWRAMAELRKLQKIARLG